VDLEEEVSFETLAVDPSYALPRSEFVLKCTVASFADPRHHALLREWVQTGSIEQKVDLPDPGPTLLPFKSAEFFKAKGPITTGTGS
jgi:hypothetical protein